MTPMSALSRLLVRRDSVLCTRCGEVLPIHAGDGTPAVAFIIALQIAADKHMKCAAGERKP